MMVDARDTAISNGRVISDTPGPEPGKHTISYARTPKMSTYLVAMIVGDDPIDLGAHSDLLYVGTPTWDVGSRTVSGGPTAIAERIHELGAMGVRHVQVRFRSRDLEEQLDQMAAFGAEVGPLLRV